MNNFTKTISVASGKGGVGKTALIANMALYLGQRGKKVLILDGDMGMANIDIMFGISSRKTIADVLFKQTPMEEVMVNVEKNVWVIPGGSGIKDLQNLSPFERRVLTDEVSFLRHRFDYLLVDTAPGLGENTLHLSSASQQIVLIVTPDPSSLADAYALAKVLHNSYSENQFSIVCNKVKDATQGFELYRRFSGVVEEFLNVRLSYLGSLSFDQYLRHSIQKQRLVLKHYPEFDISKEIAGITQKVKEYSLFNESKGGVEFFWDQLVGVA